MRIKFFFVIYYLFFFFLFNPVQAISSDVKKVMILDYSGSMFGKIENKAKIKILKEKLIPYIKETKEFSKIKVIQFGHQFSRDERRCDDMEIIAENSKKGLIKKIKSSKPKGMSPLYSAVNLAIEEFNISKDSNVQIIMVTDGINSCSGDVWKLFSEINNNPKIRIDILGLNLSKIETSKIEKLLLKSKYENVKLYDLTSLKDLLFLDSIEFKEAKEIEVNKRVERKEVVVSEKPNKKIKFDLNFGLNSGFLFSNSSEATYSYGVNAGIGFAKNLRLALSFISSGESNISSQYKDNINKTLDLKNKEFVENGSRANSIFSIDVKYFIPFLRTKVLEPYAIGGLSYVYSDSEYSARGSYYYYSDKGQLETQFIGSDLGLGLGFRITPNLSLGVEFKNQIPIYNLGSDIDETGLFNQINAVFSYQL